MTDTPAPEAVTLRCADGVPLQGHLFAADGAHSPVRKALGLDFPGDGWEEPWHLLDVDLSGPPPKKVPARIVRSLVIGSGAAGTSR